MNESIFITIVISVLSSSVVSLALSSFIFDPMKAKRSYVFDEKKRVYESILTFAQIVLYPKEAKYSLGVARYNIQELSDEENITNSLNDLKMAIPKLKLITKNSKVITRINQFIDEQNEAAFGLLLNILQKDLYR